jgi:hypothetical protein
MDKTVPVAVSSASLRTAIPVQAEQETGHVIWFKSAVNEDKNILEHDALSTGN